MGVINSKIGSTNKHKKLFEWFKLVSITGSAQILVQLGGLLTGILFIRLLSVREYAFYTLANTMLGTMTVLADGGISSGVLSQGGKIWNNNIKLGQVLATGLNLRRKFAFFSLSVALPILAYLLFRQGASMMVIFLILLTIIPSFFSALSDSLLEIVPKLHQDIRSLQENQVKVSLIRLFLSSVSIFIFPFTAVALLANGIPRIYGNIKLRKIAYKFADPNQESDIEIKKNILSVVKRIMPGSIYYCVSGQVTIWLISFFGSTDSIAKVGALSRFSMLLTVVTSVFSTVVIPRFARLKDDKEDLIRKFVSIQLLLFFLCTVICLVVYVFPEPALWILGNKFNGLGVELALSILASCLSLISGILFGLSSARGWPTHSVFLIAGNVIFVIVGAYFFSVSTLKGALYFNIFINIFPVLAHSVNFYSRTLRK